MAQSERDKTLDLKKNNGTKDDPLHDLSGPSVSFLIAPVNKGWSTGSVLRLLAAGVLMAVLIVMGYLFWLNLPAGLWQQWGLSSMATPGLMAVTTPTLATVQPTPVATALPTPTVTFLPTPPITGGGHVLTRIPTPPAGGTMVAVTPDAQAVGWASSLSGRSHFNDPNIHVGFFNGNVYHGAIQFDLSDLPAASRITYAALDLAGLGDQNLAAEGVWQVQMLGPAIDESWPVLSYDQLHQAVAQIAILPALTSASLNRDRVNTFPFGPEQLADLQQNLEQGVVSFRIDGPDSGPNNLFTWDSGLNGEKSIREKQSRGEVLSDEELIILSRKPVLWLVIDRIEYVAVTPTPTPENIFTVAAMAATVTAAAELAGTATPLPAAWVTPIVVTVPPPPANAATATYQAQVAAAEAVAFGTTTPTPLNVWTATPTPNFIFVTSTPTPDNVVTAAAQAVYATYVAQSTGTYTPVPQNWATPFVVTPMPQARNTATAEFQQLMATSQAFLSGMVWTATPTSIFVTPTPVPTFTPTPGYLPPPVELVGKIAFLSDRAGSKEETGQEPLVYIMNPDGSNVTVLSGRTFYDTALARDSFSADLRYRAYVEDFLRFDGQRVPGIYFQDYYYNTTDQLTRFGTGIAYDPVWSSTREQIAFVSNESGDDEIWVINRNGSGLLLLTTDNHDYNAREIGKDTFIPEVNRRPSWSPDGRQIVFWSNRAGNAQIWIMNADGSNQRLLSSTPFNDWNPVWIKYTDLPPLLPQPTRLPSNPFDEFH